MLVPDAAPADPSPAPAKAGSRRWMLLALGGGVLVASLLLVTAYHWLVGVPNEKLSDPEFITHASAAELVEVSERVLSLPFGNHHDACLFIGAAGDVSSVPALLRAVRMFGEPEGDGVVCTVLHCFDALKRVTGHDEGLSPRAWRAWWVTTGSKLPRSAFPPAPVYPPPRPSAASPSSVPVSR